MCDYCEQENGTLYCNKYLKYIDDDNMCEHCLNRIELDDSFNLDFLTIDEDSSKLSTEDLCVLNVFGGL
jgi:hypothetical protein